ncbi:MAG: response regulator [Chloroflexi bacterium]|nr:response regulator [Chloroflexota bacterium]
MAPDGLRVLLVEDNPGDARLIRAMLAEVPSLGWHWQHVDRLAAALPVLGAGTVDVVLLDLNLPDARGLESVERVQAVAPEVPVVVLTGLDDEATGLRAVQAGAQDYLVKGQVSGELLVRAVRYALERRQLLARERAARLEAERLAAERAAILGQIADGVLIADPTGRITFINEAGRRMHGLDPTAEPDGFQARYELVAVDGIPLASAQQPLWRAACAGETIRDAEFIIRRADGSEVIVQGSAAPVLAEDGTRLGAVLVLHDVTERHALERERDEFFSHASHDLRTPLAAIKASIGVVLANEPADFPAPLHRLLVNIDQAADRMAALVGDLLDMTRLRAGRLRLRWEWTDLGELAQRAAAAIEPLAQQRDQRVQVEVPSGPLLAPVDAARLERALLNLLTNAHHYGRPGGHIALRLEQSGDHARLAVSDDGPGIPPEYQERIFERFYRLDNDPARRTPGAGLGLAIARAIAELHGGRLWVESTPGAGSTFVLLLPLVPPADAVPEERLPEETR